MQLARHHTESGPRWALNGHFLPPSFRLDLILELSNHAIEHVLSSFPTGEVASGKLLPPLEPGHEVWASGVTYLRSRDARMAESDTADVYARVYTSDRPELFMKALGWRVVGHDMPIRTRRDSQWNVPEPEVTLVLNRQLEIVGYCAGNDVSSRDIEGTNPLYLPQAKTYSGACALGPAIILPGSNEVQDLSIRMVVERQGVLVFEGSTHTGKMKRTFEELIHYLGLELEFPQGVFLMTGTGIVPPDDFTLLPGDLVSIHVGALMLVNQVAR